MVVSWIKKLDLFQNRTHRESYCAVDIVGSSVISFKKFQVVDGNTGHFV